MTERRHGLAHKRCSASTVAIVVSSAVLSACGSRGPDTSALLDANSGGATTIENVSHKAFAQPAGNLDVQLRARFFIGNAFFNSPWVVAPASASARDGLGPLFNARSCDACHNNDGRGRPPDHEGERPVSLVIQFATPTPGDNNSPGIDPRYGANLNPFAIGGVPAEGTVRIKTHDIDGQFADGARYTLLAPEYVFEDLAYGELAHDNQFSPRVAPAVFGSGLIEAIPEQQILERNDSEDANRDGISGRPNYVWDHLHSRQAIGRLGWKANQPDIAHQTAGAFSNEIGMSTSLRPEQNCTEFEPQCVAAPTGGSPEISDEIFQHIVDYQEMLGVPARRNLEAPEVKRGAQLFLSAGCESCHRASFTTADVPNKPWLSRQTIHPFTDLLLHDMGPALADGRKDFEATGNEWRTQPLWGIGLQQTVNAHTRLLHDGRARNVTEAILWHGGEAERSQQAFLKMSADERAALLAFINSL